MNPAHTRYCLFLETLSPETLSDLTSYVTEDVHFKDPFNDLRGAQALQRVFQHMFQQVENAGFDVYHCLSEDDLCFMAWRFEGRLQNKPWAFDGTSVIRFAPDGRVSEHIDYWDAARHFYERLPVIGWLLAALRRRVASH